MVQISVKKNICVFLVTWNFKIWMVDTVGYESLEGPLLKKKKKISRYNEITNS